MKKKIGLLAAMLLAALVLTGCGKPAGLGVTTDEDNSIAVTADRAPKDSAGLGYLTVGENETVVVDANFEKNGMLRVRMMAGLLGAEDFPEEPTAEVTVSGQDCAEFTVPAGEYTVAVIADSKLTGTARLSVRPDESAGEAAPAAEDDGYYSGFTAMPRAELEAFAAQVKQAYLAQDWETIAGWVRYLITLYPDVKVQNEQELLAYMDGKTVNPSDAAALGEESCTDMFYNGQGLCLGSGQVWLLDESYMTDEAPQLYIIALSGIVEAEP